MWRVVLKFIAIFSLTAFALPFGLLLRWLLPEKYVLVYNIYYARLFAFIIGLRVITRGQMSEERPLLIVSNHISYLDIIALSSAAPLTYTPKSEIENWPIINWLCKMIGCVFVDRKRSKTQENLEKLHKGLESGKPIVLFAEGSTGDGKRLLPIRSSYFQLAESFDKPLHIQPVLLNYELVHNLPVDEVTRPRIAWVGDQELLPHVISLFEMGSITVSVNFLPVIDVSDCNNRKDMAAKCEAALGLAKKNLL